MLVDDSTLDNKLHARVINRTGLAKTVLTFSMAEDALAYLREPGAIPVDLILLDINMPRMDGFEMLEATVREFGDAFDPSVVVMLTTSLDPRDQERARSFSAIKDYFQKPLTTDRFTELVEALNG
ncbi:response regulator [Sulfitobacter sabulilitoris]|uniref:Response regulator n=1 Tax=Sulfitobacter sabulilitoris TaxID=2562655 RepID=A0A5S3PMY5_9RHOB|nr:response regulator [Sulfitobacter sabulilitoris]